jgi:RimJ/RimL family protein N-acetyltransferase
MSWTTERRIQAVIKQAKEQGGDWKTALPVALNGHLVARLEPVTARDHDQHQLIDLLARWRTAAQDWFPTQFPVSLEGTRNWLADRVLAVPDRILYWIRGDHDGVRMGHVGLFHLDDSGTTMELDNVVKAVSRPMPGLMQACVHALMGWAEHELGLQELSLRVFADNERAIRLYERCGFHTACKIPLVKIAEGETTSWIERASRPDLPVDRIFLEMRRPLGNTAARPLPRAAAA